MVCFRVWEKTYYKFLYQSSSGITFSCLPISDRNMNIDKGFGYHVMTEQHLAVFLGRNIERIIFLAHVLI